MKRADEPNFDHALLVGPPSPRVAPLLSLIAAGDLRTVAPLLRAFKSEDAVDTDVVRHLTRAVVVDPAPWVVLGLGLAMWAGLVLGF